jgi:hypothetical protein
MKSGPQLGLAVVAGYVLGRRRRLRLALALGAAASTGRMGVGAGALLRRGGKALGSSGALGKVSPELSEITGMIRGELLDAGKSAAAAVVSGRLDALTERLHERAELIRSPRREGDEEDEEFDERDERDERDEPREDVEEEEEDEEFEPEEEDEPVPRAATRRRPGRTATEAPIRRRR